MCDSPRTGCAWRTTSYIYVAQTSNKRVIMACELYCCLLPQCEALRTCRMGFPIATQAFKYDVIAYTPYEGINYTVVDKIKPLWKRTDEPPEIQIGCYRGDPGQQRYSALLIIRFVLTEFDDCKPVRRLHHWNFHLLKFWLDLLLVCCSYATINEKLVWSNLQCWITYVTVQWYGH